MNRVKRQAKRINRKRKKTGHFLWVINPSKRDKIEKW